MMSHFDIKMEKVNVFIFLGKTFNVFSIGDVA